MEAPGRAPPANIEQKIRRALSDHDASSDAADRFYDRIQGFSDRK